MKSWGDWQQEAWKKPPSRETVELNGDSINVREIGNNDA